MAEVIGSSPGFASVNFHFIIKRFKNFSCSGFKVQTKRLGIRFTCEAISSKNILLEQF